VGKIVGKAGKDSQEKEDDIENAANDNGNNFLDRREDDTVESECFFSEDNIKKSTITKYPVDNPKDDDSEISDKRHGQLINSDENSVR
jgi:hypothetical protein